MEIEDIIQLLISKTGKTRNDILNLIEKKQLDAGGTITDKAAASLVSKDLGLKLSEINVAQPTKISDLLHMAPHSSNITITGTIKRMYSSYQFSTEDNNKVVQNLVLIDSSTSIRVVIWGNMVKIVENLHLIKGDQIRIIKGSLKNGRMGERELHLNDSSSIEKLDFSDGEDIIDVWSDVLLPSSITKEHTSIREIDIQGVVVNTYKAEEEERPSYLFLVSPEGDESSKLKVNFWRERKKEIETLEVGQQVLVEGVTVKEGLQNTLEANFNRNSNLSILRTVKDPKKYQKIAESLVFRNIQNGPVDKNIDSIQMGENFNLNVKIAWIGKLGVFDRKDGSKGNFLRVGIYDNTGSSVIVFWDDTAQMAKNFEPKDLIKIHNAYLRENKGNYDISIGRNGKLEKIDKNKSPSNINIPNNLPAIPIEELNKNWKLVSLWGGVLSINDERTFKRNDGSEGKVKSIDIGDNTGQIRLVAWNNNINIIDNVEIGKIIFVSDVTLRMNNYNQFEAHLNDYSHISTDYKGSDIPKWLENYDFKPNPNQFKRKSSYDRISLELLSDEYKEKFLEESENGSDYSNMQNSIELRANIVEIFENPLFYESCPQCMKKVEKLEDGTGNCPNHDIVSPVPRLLFRVVLDDGLNTLVTTLIGTAAEKVTGFNPEKLKEFLIKNNDDKQILRNELKDILFGKEFYIKGKLEVRKNFSQEEEYLWDLRINYITEADPTYELHILENK